MPATSKAQQHVFAAAEHGATFPMARKLRESMSLKKLAEFARTPTKGLPLHAKSHK